jgi:hypothetical protein
MKRLVWLALAAGPVAQVSLPGSARGDRTRCPLHLSDSWTAVDGLRDYKWE